MIRKLVYALSVAVAAAAAFVGASVAINTTDTPDIPSWLPASKLPVSPVPDAAKAGISELLDQQADRYGISDASYENSRILASTSEGPLYAIPGSAGLCLALASSVACSDDLSASAPVAVALFVPTEDRTLVGGGIVTSANASVVAVFDDGFRATLESAAGVFVVSSGDKLSADHFAGIR